MENVYDSVIARNGTSKNCRRRYLVIVEEDWQEEGEEDKGSGERQVRHEIIKEVMKSSEKMTVEERFINEGKRTGGLDPMQSRDCSQIENEKEEESWQGGDRMAKQREEEQHVDEMVERRRMDGSSLKLDAMHKVPELVVNEKG